MLISCGIPINPLSLVTLLFQFSSASFLRIRILNLEFTAPSFEYVQKRSQLANSRCFVIRKLHTASSVESLHLFTVCWVSKWSWCPGAMRLEADTKKTLYCSCFFNCNFYFYLCIGLHLSECMWVTTEYRRGNQILCIWSYRNYKNLLDCLHLIGTTKAFIITDEVAAGS